MPINLDMIWYEKIAAHFDFSCQLAAFEHFYEKGDRHLPNIF